MKNGVRLDDFLNSLEYPSSLMGTILCVRKLVNQSFGCRYDGLVTIIERGILQDRQLSSSVELRDIYHLLRQAGLIPRR